MREACAARSLKPLLEGPASSKEAHRSVVRADARLPGESQYAGTLDIDPPEGHGVLGLERARGAQNAPAGFRPGLVVHDNVAESRLDSGRDSLCRRAAAAVVHERVAEHSEEPVHRGLRVKALGGTLDATHEGALQDVFRRASVAQTLLEKSQEAPMVVDEDPEDLRIRGRRRVIVVPWVSTGRDLMMRLTHVSIPSAFNSSFEAESATVPAGWS